MFGPCEFASEIRATSGSRVDNFDLREEAVAAASNGFDKAGTLGGVAEGLTDFVNRFVQAVVEIHESVCGPKFLLKFLATAGNEQNGYRVVEDFESPFALNFLSATTDNR